jgi:hypothetical protein
MAGSTIPDWEAMMWKCWGERFGAGWIVGDARVEVDVCCCRAKHQAEIFSSNVERHLTATGLASKQAEVVNRIAFDVFIFNVALRLSRRGHTTGFATLSMSRSRSQAVLQLIFTAWKTAPKMSTLGTPKVPHCRRPYQLISSLF